MRIREDFTVFPRTLKSGLVVFYYQTYDGKGKRQNARSTGKTLKTEAKAFCMRLFKDGLLIPEQKVPMFSEFSNGWWNLETCRYLKRRQLHEPITISTIDLHKSNFDNHVKEYFANYRLDEITTDVLEGWLLLLSERGLKPNTVNLQYRTLKLMMGEAFRQKLIKHNPCLEVKDVKAEETERKILTVEEVKKLFPPNWQALWESPVVYKAHRLAACTGLRISELRGLRGEYVFDDYIYITGQFTSYGYIPNTKTKQNRNIPISPVMRQELEELLMQNGDGYVFSNDGGTTPISYDRIRRQYDKALQQIGISYEEKLRRNLSFHAWRHFFNTLLRMSNVADSKVQKVTGHRSMKMTDHYTHFDTRQFNEVRNVQAELLALPDNTKKAETKKIKGRGKAAAVKKASGKKKAKA